MICVRCGEETGPAYTYDYDIDEPMHGVCIARVQALREAAAMVRSIYPEDSSVPVRVLRDLRAEAEKRA